MLASIAKRFLVVAVIVAGCAGTAPSTTAPATLGPSATPQSLATAIATTAQSPQVLPTAGEPTEPPIEPTAAPIVPCTGEGTTTTFEPDSIVCVVAGPLRLRSRPNTSDESVKFEELLQTGQRLFVIDGPTDGSGYAWYLVQNTPGWIGDRADGWVAAAAQDGTPWLATTTVSCPASPSLQDLAMMGAVLRIHCYHAREFTFTGVVEAGPMCGDGVVLKSPTWMAGCFSTLWWGTPKALIVAIPPNLGDVAGADDVDVPFEATITAHMDDPAALTCVPNVMFEETDYVLLNPGMVLLCRSMFVATSFQRITP